MKQLFIVANWKANALQAKDWLEEISHFQFPISDDKEKILIICPGFHQLSLVKEVIREKQLPFEVGAQDVSAFPVGAYTGEVPAELLRELATYVIIGHSERRDRLQESDELLEKKVALAVSRGLQSIYCVRSAHDPVPMGVTIVAYEPVGSIGSGQPDSPEDANEIAQQIKETYTQVEIVLYGGSVTSENVNSFTSQEHIAGVLVGTDSLDAKKFARIIQQS